MPLWENFTQISYKLGILLILHEPYILMNGTNYMPINMVISYQIFQMKAPLFFKFCQKLNIYLVIVSILSGTF